MGIKLFKEQNLRNKLLIIYVVGFLIPMLSINTLFSYNVYLKELDFDKKNLESQLSKTSLLIQNEINEVLQIIYSVYINEDLADLLQNDDRSSSEYLKSRKQAFKSDSILSQLRTYDIQYTIYTKNSSFRPDPVIKSITSKVESKLWYREFTQSEKTAHLHYSKENPYYISIIRTLDYSKPLTKRWDNILKADIPLTKIIKHLREFQHGGGITLLSGKNDVIYKSKGIKDSDYTVKVNFEDFKLLEEWALLGDINNREFKNNIFKNNYIALFMIFIVVLGSALIFILSRSFYSRIYNLSDKIKSINSGKFEYVEIVDGQKDEITELAQNYNSMIGQIDKLINEVSESKLRENNIELAKNKAQLDALISQINPHYLFNVLESIRMKSIIKNEKETAGIIKHLSKSFRHTISWDESIIPIKKELEIANDFLIVQKYRFGDKLNYVFNVEDECYNVLIPRLTLQPFIENSCIHGIEKSSSPGTIVIDIKKIDNNLICKITDDGVGMSDEQVYMLHSRISEFDQQSKHIGFSNAYWRLKKYYSGFNLEIDTEPGSGTTIKLTIPLDSRSSDND